MALLVVAGGWHATPSTAVGSMRLKVAPRKALRASGMPWSLPQDHGTTRKLEDDPILSRTAGRGHAPIPATSPVLPPARGRSCRLAPATARLGRLAHGLGRGPDPRLALRARRPGRSPGPRAL